MKKVSLCRSIPAKGSDGKKYTIHEFIERDETVYQGGGRSSVEGMKIFKTENGQPLNYNKDKGKFELHTPFGTIELIAESSSESPEPVTSEVDSK